jgi:plastocyanin
MNRARRGALAVALALQCTASVAAEPEIHLLIQNHRFDPAELAVPAGQKIRLVVENSDATPEEFESYALNREKVVPGGQKAIVFVGPLKPGRYEFFGDFNPGTARGWLVAQ